MKTVIEKESNINIDKLWDYHVGLMYIFSTQFYSYNNNCCNEYKINILIHDCDHTGIALWSNIFLHL